MLPPHLSPNFLHQHQPHKLAPYQSHFHTQSHPDLLLFASLHQKTQQLNPPIKIPRLLTFLPHNNTNTQLK
ncbi:cytochrome ubiquinol oxidase subunit I, partial [Staphylococcus saprophyticus]|uniref:cytochrome ubiquinol oxidase subunit I n=1 Tax=Staphylococcus saprophyticus TaxID=29385 RepID=UPI0021B375C8